MAPLSSFVGCLIGVVERLCEVGEAWVDKVEQGARLLTKSCFFYSALPQYFVILLAYVHADTNA
jgi:hypothetical protein